MIKIIFTILLLLSSSIFADQQELTLVLDWFANPDHAPLFVADQEGFFAKQNLKVNFIQPADASAAEKMVAAGKADIGITYEPTFRLNNLPLVHFATLIDSPLDCLVVLQDGPIKKLSDLKGKRIGYSTPGTDDLMIDTMLKKVGLTTNDVQLINVHFDLVQALLAGKIDGFTGAMRNLEPLQIEMAGKKVRLFYPEDYGFPKYAELILVTNKNEANDPRLKKFVIALQQGVNYLLAHPEASWQKFAKNHPELNNELNHKVWFATLKYFAKNPASNLRG